MRRRPLRVSHARACAHQEELSFLLAAGIGRAPDAAASILYAYFAASANRTAAQMALGCALLPCPARMRRLMVITTLLTWRVARLLAIGIGTCTG
jgi:hypothetical protein